MRAAAGEDVFALETDASDDDDDDDDDDEGDAEAATEWKAKEEWRPFGEEEGAFVGNEACDDERKGRGW